MSIHFLFEPMHRTRIESSYTWVAGTHGTGTDNTDESPDTICYTGILNRVWSRVENTRGTEVCDDIYVF